MNSHITFSAENGVARIYINRPEKRNALGIQTIEEIKEALSAIEKDPSIRVVILSGTGTRAFAAGADLDELPGAFVNPDSARSYDIHVTRLYEAIDACRTPVIARIGGHAIGGGCLLALACDLRIASDAITVGFPVARIGLMLSPYEHELLLRCLPASRVKYLMFSARRLSSTDAMSWGLLDRVVPADQLDAEVDALVAEIVSGAPLAIQEAKKILNALDRSLNAEGAIRDAYQRIYSSKDLVEGLTAINAGRKPIFRGI